MPNFNEPTDEQIQHSREQYLAQCETRTLTLHLPPGVWRELDNVANKTNIPYNEYVSFLILEHWSMMQQLATQQA